MTPAAAATEAPTGHATEPGTNATPGARRIAAAFARARAEGRAALIPYVVAGYPDADTSLEIALAAADAGADLLEVGLPYSDPLADGATLQRASGVALGAGATLERSLRLIERIGAARPDLPLVPMGYANQVIGGGDGEAVAKRLAAAGAAGLIVADLTPDEGAPFEAVARAAGLAVVYLVAPTTPPCPPRRGRRPERRLPVLRLARRRHRRSDDASGHGRTARPRCQGGLAGPGRGRLRREPASPRPRDREGRRRWRHRGLGAGRCPRPRRPGRRIAGAPGPRPPGRHLDACRVPVPEVHRRHRRGDAEEGVRHGHRLARLVALGQDRGAGARALAAAGPRYAKVAAGGGRDVPGAVDDPDAFEVVERTGGGGGTEFGVPSSITDLDRKRSQPRKPRPRGSPASLPRPGPYSTESPLRAPAELRKGPRGGGRDRDKMIGHVIEADSAYAREMGIRQQPPDPTDRAAIEAMRAAMLEVLRQPIGRLAARGAQVDDPLRRATDRLARPRPRLGDGGPDRALGAGRSNRRPTSAAATGRAVSISPAAAAASPISSRRRPARRAQVPDRGVAVGLGELRAVRSADQRVMGERRGCLRGRAGARAGSAPPSRPAGRVRERRGRCPGEGRRRRPRIRTSSSRRGRGSAGRRSVRPRRRTGRRSRPSTAPSRPPARRAGRVRPGHDAGSPPGSPARASDGRARGPTPRTWTACSRSRTRGPRRATVPAPRRTARRRPTGAPGPPSATNPSHVRSSSSAASNRGRQRTAVVVLDPQQHRTAGRGGEAPHPDRVRHVAQVEVAGRGRREAGQRPARERRRGQRSSSSPPSRPAVARARSRSRASSARVAAISRR